MKPISDRAGEMAKPLRRHAIFPNSFVGAIVAVAAAATATLALGQGTSAPAPAPSAAAAAPVIGEEADRLLKQMGSYIGSADQFTFHADILFDQVLPSGQKLQFAAEQDVALKRPSGLYVAWNGDLGARKFWYDGKTTTLDDPAAPFYASAAAPSDIDAMLNTLAPQLNFSLPLVDFLYRDPYQAVRTNVQYGFDLGEGEVSGRTCRMFAFVEKDIDWQIWIENGPQRTPCKLIITYKNQASQPQFAATFSDWNFQPRIDTTVFTPDLPQGSEKIPFATVAAGTK